MQKRAFIYIIAAGILWGTSGIFVSILAPMGFTSFQMTAVRACVSFLGMLLFILIRDRAALRVRVSDMLLFLATGVSLFFVGSCYFTLMQLTSVSTAVILMYAAPIYVAIYSALFLGEKFSRLKIAAVALMLVGCVLVSGVIGGLRFDLAGILIGVMSGVSYGAYNILTKIALRRGCKPSSTTLYTFMFMSLLSLCVCDPTALVGTAMERIEITLPLMLLLGIVTFILPYLLYTLALKTLSAATAAALAVVEPMSATVFGAVLLGEPISVMSGAGILLVLLAVFLLSRSADGREGTENVTEQNSI